MNTDIPASSHWHTTSNCQDPLILGFMSNDRKLVRSIFIANVFLPNNVYMKRVRQQWANGVIFSDRTFVIFYECPDQCLTKRSLDKTAGTT